MSHPLVSSRFARLVLSSALALTAASNLVACDLVDAVEDRLNGPDVTPSQSADVTSPGESDATFGASSDSATSPNPSNDPSTDPAPTPDPDPTPAPKPPLSVAFHATLRIVIVNGQQLMECNADWSASGAARIAVDVQWKSNTQPDWRDALTDQEASDAGDFPVYGGRQDYYFRAVAQDLDDPSHVGTSEVVVIRQ